MNLSTRGQARSHVLGIWIDAFTTAQAVGRCTEAMEHGKYLSVGVVNAAKIVAMRRDIRLKQAVSGCQMILADGQSVVWASRMLRVPLPERVAGIDLFLELLAEAEQRGRRVYFLGAHRTSSSRCSKRWVDVSPNSASPGPVTAISRPTKNPRSRPMSAVPKPPCCFSACPPQEGALPEPVGRGHWCARRPWRWGVVRCARRSHKKGPSVVPEARPRMVLPRAAGATAARSPLSDDQCVVHCPACARSDQAPCTPPADTPRSCAQP